MKAAPTIASSMTAALLVAFVGCRSEEATGTPAPTPDAAAEEASVDAGVGGVLAVGCPGETPSDYPWAPPVPRESACRDSDLAKLSLAIKGKGSATVGELRDALGSACAACAIGGVRDAAWRAIVDGHEGYIGNVGGCVVQLGATEACGRSTDRLSTCLIIGCAGCTEGPDQDVCADALTTVNGACAEHLRAVRKDCRSGSIGDAFSSTGPCQSFVETIRLFCGPSPTDAGTD